jgi:hypothetical protein
MLRGQRQDLPPQGGRPGSAALLESRSQHHILHPRALVSNITIVPSAQAPNPPVDGPMARL